MFPKLPAFLNLSILPFSLHNFQSIFTSFQNGRFFCGAVCSSERGKKRDGRKEKERSESKERVRARGYQYSHCRRYTQVFFLAVWIWQRIFCIVRGPIYPLSNMVLRANHTEMIHMHTHFKDTNTLTEDLRTHGHKRTTCAYTQAPPYTHIYIKQVLWNKPKHVACLKFNQQQMSVWDSGCMWLPVPLPSLTIISANPIRGDLIASEPARWWEGGMQSDGHLRQIGFITSP